MTEANFDCSGTGIALQAMDSSHVSLVAMQLKADGFEHYRCDRDMSIGMNMASLSKILKCANNDDVITIKAEDVSAAPPTKTPEYGANTSSRASSPCSPLPAPIPLAGRRGCHLHV